MEKAGPDRTNLDGWIICSDDLADHGDHWRGNDRQACCAGSQDVQEPVCDRRVIQREQILVGLQEGGVLSRDVGLQYHIVEGAVVRGGSAGDGHQEVRGGEVREDQRRV